MRTKFIKVVGLCLLGIFFLNAGVQDSSVNNQIVYNVGAGLGMLDFGYDAGAYFQFETTMLGVRYLRTHEIRVELGFGGTPAGITRPIESIWTIDVYYGKKFYSRNFTIMLLGGVGILGGIQRGKYIGHPMYEEYEHLNKITYGIPLEARLSFTPAVYFDLGVSYMANINPRKTFQGFLTSFKIHLPSNHIKL